jgi:hypothetical protein
LASSAIGEPEQPVLSACARLSAGLVATVLLSSGILWYFHDQFWYAPDDGAYGYIAERMLSGAVLHKDIQDPHPGYVHAVNAFSFWLFGVNLVSLRYILCFLGVVQAALVYLMLASSSSVVVAAVAATGLTSLAFVQFLNPTANWYALFLSISIAFVLQRRPANSQRRNVVLGALLAVLVLFRQPTGAAIGGATLLWLLFEAPAERQESPRWLAKLFGILLFLVLGLYLARHSRPAGFLLMGAAPMAFIALSVPRLKCANSRTLSIVGQLGLGGTLGAAPLFIYHLWHGSFVDWIADAVGAANALVNLDFFNQAGYGVLLFGSLRELGTLDLGRWCNAFFWTCLLFFPLLLGASVIRRLIESGSPLSAGPLPTIALFYGLVSVHFEIPVYLLYTSGLTVVGLTAFADTAKKRHAFLAGTAALAAVGLTYQAGQPLERGLLGTIRGIRIVQVPSQLRKASLNIPAAQGDRYRKLVSLIQRETEPAETVLAIPVNPELYFLADRRAPFPFYSSAIGIRDDESLEQALAVMSGRTRPRLVFYNPGDKYNSPLSDRLMDYVRQHYGRMHVADDFEIYRYPK